MEAIWQDVKYNIFMLLTYNTGITCGSTKNNVAAVFSLADSNRRVCLSVTALDVNARHRNKNGQTVLKCYSSLFGTNVLNNGCFTHDET